jgi:hypothetical protein
MREVFAGFLTPTGHQAGRLIEFSRRLGDFASMPVMVIPGNGAEGHI